MKVPVVFTNQPDENTEALLGILKTLGLKATFFVTSRKAMRNRDLVRRIYTEGHEVQAQPLTDSDTVNMTPEQIRFEIERCKLVINGIGIPTPWVFTTPEATVSEEIIERGREVNIEHLPVPNPMSITDFSNTPVAMEEISSSQVAHLVNEWSQGDVQNFGQILQTFQMNDFQAGKPRKSKDFNPGLNRNVEIE